MNFHRFEYTLELLIFLNKFFFLSQELTIAYAFNFTWVQNEKGVGPSVFCIFLCHYYVLCKTRQHPLLSKEDTFPQYYVFYIINHLLVIYTFLFCPFLSIHYIFCTLFSILYILINTLLNQIKALNCNKKTSFFLVYVWVHRKLPMSVRQNNFSLTIISVTNNNMFLIIFPFFSFFKESSKQRCI